MVRCFAQRVLSDGGRAAGVEGVYTDPESGRSTQVTVRAPRVVVACGALESPALLLRSGIGGPAAGKHLRLHPCTAVFATYPEDQRAWWGAPHAGLVDEFANVEDGYGFLIEATQYAVGTGASALPFTSGEQHKELMAGYRDGATFIGLLRDHGGGQVTIDEACQAVPWYSLTDPLDVRNTHRALDAQVRLHKAAGAVEIAALAAGLPRWRRGDDVERYPEGELHDTPGVWIGDASAFPTASGTNPMITIMALASRTGEAIKAASTAGAAAATA